MKLSSASWSPDLTYPRFWQASGWLAVFVVITLTVAPKLPPVPVSFLSWDKAQHLIAYAGLMWWFRQAFAPRAIWVVFLTMLGIVLEGIQGLTDTRYFEFSDMLANAMGVSLGVLLASTRLGRTLAWADHRILPRLFSRSS